MKPTLFVEQKITPFVNKYKVLNASGDEKGQVVAYAQQKRLAFKEKVTFYSDERKNQAIFTLRAEKVFDVHGKYLIEDMDGQLIGALQKEFKKSLVNSTWTILDANLSPVCTVNENNQTLAILRRYLGFLSEIADLVLLFFKYHFTFKDASGAEHGRYTKTKLLRDHYRLDADETLSSSVDWRVLAAMAVALDALQSR
jgi:uncharacterized protein YxjI